MKRQTSSFFNKLALLRAVVLSASLITLTPRVFAVDQSMATQAGNTVTASSKKEVAQDGVTTQAKNEKLLFSKALRVIKRTFRRAKASGTPYFISCQYKIKDNKPVAASTEVRFLDYRKEAELRSVEITPVDGKLDRVVEFVYKPKNGTLAVVDRDPENLSKRLATRKQVGIDI